MAFDIDKLGDRTRPALTAILDTLDDGEWHTHSQLMVAGLGASDLVEKSVDNLIANAWRARLYQRHKPRGVEATYRLRP